MNQDILNHFVKTMTDLLSSAKDFTLAQAPDICRQVIAREMWTDAFWVVAAVAGTLVVRSMFVLNDAEVAERRALAATPYGKRSGMEDSRLDWLYARPWIARAFSVPGAIIALLCLRDLIQVYAAPKLFLIEYFAALIRTRG